MPKTRDFAVLCTACLFASILAGFLLVGDETPPPVPVAHEPVMLLDPRESYGVEVYREEKKSEAREVFIEKVRNSYVPETASPNEAEMSAVETSRATTSSATAVDETYLPYGDTGL